MNPDATDIKVLMMNGFDQAFMTQIAKLYQIYLSNVSGAAGAPAENTKRGIENAVAAYGLDGTALAAVAERIGPSADLLGQGEADAALVDHFDQRSGYRRAAEAVDTAAIDAVLDRDLAVLAPTR